MPSKGQGDGIIAIMDAFSDRVAKVLQSDRRCKGLLRHGSSIEGLDRYSDLDLTILAETKDLAALASEREVFVAKLGDLASYTPVNFIDGKQLIFCLYRSPLLRVDIYYADLSALDARVETPQVVWDGMGGEIEARLQRGVADWPTLDPDVLDSGFWIWLHQGARRLGRGEIFEVIDVLSIIRARYIGPMLLRRNGLAPRGLRRIEQKAPDQLDFLRATLCDHDPRDCARALQAAALAYIELRNDAPPAAPRTAAEIDVLQYLDLVATAVELSHGGHASQRLPGGNCETG